MSMSCREDNVFSSFISCVSPLSFVGTDLDLVWFPFS
jgi:hypothetical protein